MAMEAGSHMSVKELQLLEARQKDGKTPKEIVNFLQNRRAKAGGEGPSASAVYRHLKGETYRRSAAEKRGRKSTLPPRWVHTAMQQPAGQSVGGKKTVTRRIWNYGGGPMPAIAN